MKIVSAFCGPPAAADARSAPAAGARPNRQARDGIQSEKVIAFRSCKRRFEHEQPQIECQKESAPV